MTSDFKKGYQDGQIHYLLEFAVKDVQKLFDDYSVSEDTISAIFKLVKSQIKNFNSMNVVVFNRQGKKVFGNNKFKKIESILNIINRDSRFSTEDLFDDVKFNKEVEVSLYRIVDSYDSDMIKNLYCLNIFPLEKIYNFDFFIIFISLQMNSMMIYFIMNIKRMAKI